MTIILTIISVTSEVGLGTMVSEKMLGRDGVTNSSLLLARTGAGTELSVMGFAPTVYTSASTGLGGDTIPTATLHGVVTNMLGMPSATGYFVWGYSATVLSNTTATVPITGTGDYSVTITGFDKNEKVYYQFYTDADGTAYGAVSSFIIPSGVGGYLIKNLLRVILAGIILIGVIRIGGGAPMRILLLSAIGIIGFAIISSFIETLF
jgi:hypothetical protein